MQPILKVNLATGDRETYTVPEAWEREYLGGAALASRLLYDSLTPDVDPFAPESPLLFLNGPLSGTSGPAVGRFVVCGRSPATGLWAESNCGGFWGPELRMAGYAGLWLTGRAPHPVYLWIQDGEVQVRPADHIWGLDTYQTQAAVEAELKAGKIRVAVIGPAGENLLPYALILTDHGRVAGRTGLGAVMGSKNLKAIAVQGHGKIPVFDPEHYSHLRSAANKALRSDAMSNVLRELGTSGAAEYFDYLGEMPKRYFRHETLKEDVRTTGATLKETILTGISACHACVIACGRVVSLGYSDQEHPDGKRKGPEYETMIGFGPNLCLNDPVLATRLGELCDRYGMDTISLSSTIGLAFRLFELGKIRPVDTGGLYLDWGNAAAAEQLVHQTVIREGLGVHIAEGARELARRFFAPEEAVQVNGLEIAYHDPRGASGMALVYATSPRGACHNQSDYFFVDVGQVEHSLGMEYYGRQDGPEKAGNVAIHQNWRTVSNALVLCLFANVPPETVRDLVNAACGTTLSLADLLKIGERAWTLKRVINLRLGLTAANDKLPPPLLRPYVDAARGTEGFVPDFENMLAEYYQVRSWHPVTGMPSRRKLEELQLGWVEM